MKECPFCFDTDCCCVDFLEQDDYYLLVGEDSECSNEDTKLPNP